MQDRDSPQGCNQPRSGDLIGKVDTFKAAAGPRVPDSLRQWNSAISGICFPIEGVVCIPMPPQGNSGRPADCTKISLTSLFDAAPSLPIQASVVILRIAKISHLLNKA